MINLDDIIQQLESLGTEQAKSVFINHGSQEPLFGVRVGEMKKIKGIKNNTELAIALYNTGNYDAMYLAGVITNPKEMSKEILEKWMKGANCYMLSEYAVASVVASTPYAIELAKVWIEQEEELIASGGWSTYSNYLSVTPNEELDLEEVRRLLDRIKMSIHEQLPRIRYTMNGFVLSVGVYIPELNPYAIEVAESIGKVTVKMEKTSCQVPDAKAMIQKVMDKGKCGHKRKSCRC